MQIAWVVATLGGTKSRNGNVVSAARIRHRVKGLAKVADKVNQKLQGFAPRRKRLPRIAQDSGKLIDPGHHAIIVRAVLRLIPA
jgi:hypothetical protein